MISGTYNNNVQIVQTRDYIVLQTEMIHEARIIPLTARPHGALPGGSATRAATGRATRSWSRPSTSSGRRALLVRAPRRSWSNASRGSAAIRSYEFTVSDPTTLTKPWTAVEPLTRIDEMMYEYACHEGNIGMTGILTGARFLEKEEAQKKSGRGVGYTRTRRLHDESSTGTQPAVPVRFRPQIQALLSR